MFQELYPNVPKSALKNFINKNTHLVAYNKEKIKQLGTCVLKVNYGGKTLPQEFFMVGSRFRPTVGLDASLRLGLLMVNCPGYQSWTRNAPIDSISGANADVPEKITKEWIVNNPKYKHLFKGIGRFQCKPVLIKLNKEAKPVQKPPQRVPLALKDQFQQELDNMVSQGILSKLDDANVNAPERLNSFAVVKKPNGKLCICLDPTNLNPYIQGGHGTGKTGNLAVNFSRQGKHREFSKFNFLHGKLCQHRENFENLEFFENFVIKVVTR